MKKATWEGGGIESQVQPISGEKTGGISTVLVEKYLMTGYRGQQ